MAKRRDHGEGSVFERSDGKWVATVDFGFVNGKRKRVNRVTVTKKEALVKLKEMLALKERNAKPIDPRLTLEKFIGAWLAAVKPNLAPRSYERYNDVMRIHVLPVLGKTSLPKLTTLQISEYLRKKLDDVSPNTVITHHAVIRTSLNWAIRMGLLTTNPARFADLPKETQYEAKFLTPAEAVALLEMAEREGNRYQALYLMALTLGMRQGELLGLRWVDLDFETAVVRISQNLQRNPNNNGKLELKVTKTKMSKRALPLTDDLIAALRRHKARQAQERLLAGPEKWQDTGLVFTTRNGTPVRAAGLLTVYKRLLTRAGLPQRRFHDLRHSTASFLLSKGVPMKQVSEILGHSDMRTTAEIYAHTLPGATKQAMEAVSDLLKTG